MAGIPKIRIEENINVNEPVDIQVKSFNPFEYK